ncbi:MAG: transcription termination factor Rho [Leucobacter sp.]
MIVEQNSEETTAPAAAQAAPAAEAQAPAEAAPVRRRVSRRVSAPAGEAAPEPAAAEAPQKTRTTRSKAAAAEPAAAPEAPASEAAPAAAESEAPAEAPKKRQSRARKKVEAPAEEGAAPAAAQAEAPAEASADAAPAAAPATGAPAESEAAAEAPAAPKKRATRSRGKKAADAPAETQAEASAPAGEAAPATDQAEAPAESAEAQAAERPARGERPERNKGPANGGQQAKNGDSQTRSSRTRQRERKRRQGDDLEPEIAEDDVLLPIAGILDVLDNYAFVRTSGYLPGTNDVYVSLGQVKKYGLRKGDAVVGAIRQPREGEGGGRQKYNAIVKIDAVNSRPVDDTDTRPEFAELVPLAPEQRLRLETAAETADTRLIDLFAPVGLGQRGIVVGPSRSGKSTLLTRVADSVSKNQPEAHLMLVVVDERPEEVTRLQRSVAGEVIASTFDRPAEDHATVAELAVERAKRLVELGHDVVVLIDSLSSLTRAYNLLGSAANRQPAGLIDPGALAPVKKLLGAARNIENGGSLTILATAQSGSAADEAILDELLGTANLEIRLSRELAQKQLFPAVLLASSGTRGEELLTGEPEAGVIRRLRGQLAERSPEEALESVLQQLRDTSSNVEFLTLAQRSQTRS